MKRLFKKLLPKKILRLRHLAYALIGAIVYRFPSKSLYVIGVTGTSGKSSTTAFLRELFTSQGYTVGSLSTVDFVIDIE